MKNTFRTINQNNTIRENISNILVRYFGVYSSKAQETMGAYIEYDGGTPKYYAD